MTTNPSALRLRAKKLGVLMQAARQSAGRSADDVAVALGVPGATLEAFELGEVSPSLPQLEQLSASLNVPLDHFWGSQAWPVVSTEAGSGREQLTRLRQRKIGVQLRQARQSAGLSLEAAAEAIGVAPAELEAYEFGEQPVPLPRLENLSAALHLPLQEMRAQRGPAQPTLSPEFLRLPPDLQEFVSRPVNRPYLEVAKRLSEMSVEKLRAVAEGLLEITL